MAERGTAAQAGPTCEQSGPAQVPDMDAPHLCEIRGCYTGTALDYGAPCTASETQTCQIVRHLSTWNEVLCQARFELRESSPRCGQLSLTSFEKPFLTVASSDQRKQSIALACQLLKTHRCVATLDVSVVAMEPGELTLLVDALRESSYVKVLKFRNPRFASARSQEDLCRLITSLHSLQQLDCPTAWKCTAAFLDVLVWHLRNNAYLTALRIPMICIKCHSAECFLEALRGNSSLTDLSLDESFLGDAPLTCRAEFTEYLRITTTLTSLTVVACNKLQDSLKYVLEGLLGNSTVSKVTLTNFIIDEESAKLVPKIFELNATIKTFSMVSTRQDFEMLESDMYDGWLLTLTDNKTLDAVRLPFCAGKSKEWGDFFRVLPTKRSLKITIELNFTHYDVLPQICEALKEAGAEDQVFFETNFPPNSADTLQYKGFSEICACLRSDTRSEFLRIMQMLPSASHVTSVQLGVSTRAVDNTLISAVADYIRGTLALQRLHLILYCDPAFAVPRSGFLKAIILSLAQNTSLKELHMKVPEMEDEDIHLLARTVKSLHNMQRIYFVPERARDANAFFEVLRADIASNYTLLSLTVDVSINNGQATKDWFAAWDTTRRNSGLLIRAALFVSGIRCDRPCGEAAERMGRHPALPEQVADLASVSEAQAAAMIRNAVMALQDMNEFMRLTGVVNRCVVCLPARDGGAQLDDLNEDCWRAIRSHILLADVRIP